MKDLLESKKFRVLAVSAVTTVLMNLAAHFQLGLDAELAKELSQWLVGLAVAYLVGQGLADMGKEKAKEERKTLEVGVRRTRSS